MVVGLRSADCAIFEVAAPRTVGAAEAQDAMFEWICPKCDRPVLAEMTECPHCAAMEVELAAARSAERPGARPAPRGFGARKKFDWADVDRGFRFGLGFLAALAIGYFLLFAAALVWDHPEWLARLTRVLRLR